MPGFALGKLISHIVQHYKPAAARKGICLEVVDDLASDVILTGKARELRALIDHVICHTLDGSGASKVKFSAEQLLRSEKEVLLEFQLEENGLGEGKKRNFSYYRTLIGARQVIEDLGGKSEIVVSTGRKTTLKFVLKCPYQPTAGMPATLQAGCATVLKGKRILIVEDNEMNQHAIMDMLRCEQIEFAAVSNGRDAIEVLENKDRFDLVLMDTYMTHMDGFRTSSYIRKILKTSVPIIGMTSGAHSEEAIKCLEAGMNQFINKPFTAAELLTQMCSFFDRAICKLNDDGSERKIA